MLAGNPWELAGNCGEKKLQRGFSSLLELGVFLLEFVGKTDKCHEIAIVPSIVADPGAEFIK